MKKTVILFAMFALGFGAFAAASTQAPKPADLSGTWIGKTEVPDAGIDDLQLVLKKEKESYSGTITDGLGVISPATEIKVVEITGDAMTLTFPLADGAMVVFRLKTAEDKIVGQWEHPSGSTGALEFARKK
jgi:hypothetical protein